MNPDPNYYLNLYLLGENSTKDELLYKLIPTSIRLRYEDITLPSNGVNNKVNSITSFIAEGVIDTQDEDYNNLLIPLANEPLLERSIYLEVNAPSAIYEAPHLILSLEFSKSEGVTYWAGVFIALASLQITTF
jgi:hypothetical protein